MDLILCHQTADFDALGAAVGLACLHPGSRIVLTGGAHPTVRQFLSLYRNELPLLEMRSVNPHQLRNLYVVDTQQGDRLGKAQAWLTLPHLDKVIIYDHHGETAGDIKAQEVHVEAVGATTTLIVEELEHHALALTPILATLMALGIHVDTGSFTFEQTTLRDIEALLWLMKQGARLQLIADYAQPSFSPQLEQLLTQAINHLQRQTVAGYEVGQVLLHSENFVPGLSHLAERLLEFTPCDALLMGHVYPRQGERDKPPQALTLIGRTRIPHTNLVPLFQALGGGGHAQAVAANLRVFEPQPLLSQLTADFIAQIPPPPTARDLMSAPVRTILPQTTLEQAQRILLRYGHSGLSVVDEQGQLVGIISRRDLDLAFHHGLHHAPVKGYMTRRVHTITPTTPLPAIEALMVTQDVGRLPVLEGGQLVGIVTRTDVLRHLLRERKPAGKSSVHAPLDSPDDSLYEHLQTRLEPVLWRFLQRARHWAQAQGWHLYLVGGAVRDLALADNQARLLLPDLDLVVDSCRTIATCGAGVELARLLQQDYPQTKLSVHGEFQTAALLWPRHSPLGPLWVDIATARTEFYPYPAANPQVEASDLRQDLYRRDFTINALALRLTAPQPGQLLDFFGGLTDLNNRQVRVLHANSFIEDPTRIFRAVRFAVRLGFNLEPQTESYIRYAVESGVYDRLRLTGHPAPALTTRLKAEFSLILKAPYWGTALKMLADLGALRCLHRDLVLLPELMTQLRLLSRWLACLDPSHRHHHWALRLTLLLTALPLPTAVAIAVNLHLSQNLSQLLEDLAAAEQNIESHLSQCQCLSQIVTLLEPYSFLLLIFVAVRSKAGDRRLIGKYLTRLSQVRPPLSGEDLKSLGYRPGPQYKTMLTLLRHQTLDGAIVDRQQAEAWLAKNFPLPMEQ